MARRVLQRCYSASLASTVIGGMEPRTAWNGDGMVVSVLIFGTIGGLTID